MKRLLLILTMGIALTLLPEQVTAQTPMEIAEGARVWADNCTRCHNARSPMERNDRQWATIVAHMRARANLTRSEANAVSVYLQAINAPETIVPQTPTPAAPPVETSQGEKPSTVQKGMGDAQGSQGATPKGNRLSEAEVLAVLQYVRKLQTP